MARSPRCARCETPCEHLETITLGLDNESVTLALCDPCARNCRADVGVWKMFGELAPSRGRRIPTTPLPRPSVFTTLPAREGPRTLGHNVHVPFPVIQRGETVTEAAPRSDAVVYEHLFNGYDIAAVERAADTWRWARGIRDEVKERDLDPVDVLLAADSDTPDKVLPGDVPNVEMRILHGLKVVVATDTHTILDAYI